MSRHHTRTSPRPIAPADGPALLELLGHLDPGVLITVGHHAPHLVAIAQKLADAGVLVIRQHRDLRGAAQLGAVHRTEARVIGVEPATQGACFHASLDSLAPAGMTAR